MFLNVGTKKNKAVLHRKHVVLILPEVTLLLTSLRSNPKNNHNKKLKILSSSGFDDETTNLSNKISRIASIFEPIFA